MKKGDAGLIVLMVAACCYLSHNVAAAGHVPTTAVFSGPPYPTPSCSGVDGGNMFVELDQTRWSDAYCGKKLRVFCMGAADPDVTQACIPSSSHSVDVVVVGLCDDCEEATMNLSKDAYCYV
ncbi:hypothetical protein KSP39_PZI011923 [Platanthera zijinensis]|uniref:EG45-like domain containing protein n=1 Tax=Platanthera zijinensis TaxID=2320716 RepID=A0AAP0BHJ9_9ASPA